MQSRLPHLLLLLATPLLEAAPIITHFTPDSGAPGAQVTVSGVGLSAVTLVEFEDQPADFWVNTNGQLVAVVPLEAVTSRIRLTAPTGAGVSSTDFVVAPRVTDFSPRRGAIGVNVTINGENFNGATNVQFNGLTATFVVTAPNQIQSTVPPGAGDGPIRVSTAAGSGTSANAFVVTGPEPIIDQFTPPIGAPGSEILIEGANFSAVTGIRFNGVPAAVFSAPAVNQIRVIVPNATTGKVTVSTAAGSGVSTNDFVITRLPVVTGFAPALGQPGRTVTIEGINFNGLVAPGVWFNTQPVAAFSTPAPNQIRVTVPSGATTGPISVRNAFGIGASLDVFTVTAAPMVTQIDPPLGNPGTLVRLTGENFTGIRAVWFNGVPANFLPPPAQNQMQAWVPATATSGPITVENTAGRFTTSSNFVVTPTFPFITRFDPPGGPRGTEVTIYGINFGAAPVVRFDEVLAPTAFVVQEGAEQRITAQVPAEVLTGPITVTGPSGFSTNAALFYAPPRLRALSPSNGVVGDQVVLTGTNFTDTLNVLFNGASASFQVEPGRLTATVPEQARSGPVSVRTPGGLISSTNSFGVLPHLTNFTPGFGPTGAVVQIQGTSFRDVSAVHFNDVSAAFTPVSLNQVNAVVPAAATTGLLEIETPDGTAASASRFFVVGPGELVLSNQPSTTLALPGVPVNYTLSITNEGPWAFSSVTVTGALPPELTDIEIQTGQGSCIVTNGGLECHLGFVTNGALVTIRLSGIFQAESYGTFNPQVTAQEDDVRPENNSATSIIVVATEASRQLRIEPVPDRPEVVLSWPVSPFPFGLQFTFGLGASNAWQPLPALPTVIADRHVLTNELSEGNRFYRLMLLRSQSVPLKR